MQPQSIPVQGRSMIRVTLLEDTEMLDELVVIGYGTMKKSDLTGAISTVTGDQLARRNATQLSTALQGAMPGLMVTRSNSTPGATADIKVRGLLQLVILIL